MTAQDFVLKHYPSARAINSPSNYNEGMKHKYTIIQYRDELFGNLTLSDGKTESNAWVNAKKAIINHPKH
jgi:hypothetical protein